MLVDLNPLPYKRALELIQWCFEHNIDQVQCARIIGSMSQVPESSDVEWILNVPDKYITYFALKWSGREY